MIFEDRVLTYAALDAHANRLAHHLHEPRRRARRRGRGLRRALARTGGGTAGMLKAGGAYLPLDPDYPRERLAFMLTDAGLRVVLVQGAAALALALARGGPPHPARRVRARAATGRPSRASADARRRSTTCIPAIWPT